MYSLFIPPSPMYKKTAREWSDEEAQQYFDWLTNLYRSRVTNLLAYLCAVLPRAEDLLESFLQNISEQVRKTLLDPEFSDREGKKPRLTPSGAALAADCGLLIAQLLIDQPRSKVHWELVKEPPDDFSFNKPVLKGFMHDLYFDPVGGTIIEARGYLCGISNFPLCSFYRHWSKLVIPARN